MESAAYNQDLMANEEDDPLMEESVGVRNTTSDFLRSFSILSDDSDFDELDEPDTPGDFLDGPGDGELSHLGYQSSVRHTTTSGISVDAGKSGDQAEGKIIPFSSIHRPAKGFTHIRPDCWMKEPVQVAITDVQRETHPHMTRKAFNPNLYIIEVTHGEYKWTVRRRYKHFDSLHKALRLFRARYTLPVPTKQHRERRQSIKEERKERKIKKKKTKKVSRFPKKPEIMVREDALEKRREHLEQYLQSILESKWYRNHTEVLNFLEVSELSFVNRLGQKWKEGDVTKCSGGRRISIGCCGCLKKYHVAGRWSKRWLVVKDTFIAYIRPRDGLVCDVLLMDSRFRVESGMSATGAKHGVLIMNQSRHLLAKAWTSRKADEWEASIKQAAETTGKDFTEENRYESYAPVRENSYARWFVDGASYFEAVAEALEKAREEIFITDWWLSPEIYLKRHVTDREKWRLDEILARKANEGVKVFVILYKELEIALTINSHYSKHALMNKSPNIKVIRHPDHVAAGNRVLLWAHHEKIVCIDQKTAFLGGFDLCYGRWDDEFHRMTDLGSVVYGVQKPKNEQVSEESPHTPVSVGGRPSHKKSKAKPRPPSTILESPENNMADSGIDECGWNISKESEEDGTQLSKETEEDGTQLSDGKENDAQGPNGKVSGNKLSNGSIQKTNMNGIAGLESDSETHRHSLHSEHDFGSNDPLTENDSLENVNKESYTNVVADVHVHADTEDVHVHDDAKDVHVHIKSEDKRTNSLSETANVKHDTDKKVDNNDDGTKKPEVDDGGPVERQRGDSNAKRESPGKRGDWNAKRSPEKRSDSNTKVESPRERMSKCDAVDEEDIELVDGAKERKVDLDSVVKQIITKHDNISNYGAIRGHSGKIAQTDNTDAQIELVSKETKVPNKSSLKNGSSSNVKQSVENLNSDVSNTSVSKLNNTDLNCNQTKGSVRFKEHEDGEIREEHITPVQGMLVEATPKKDAAGKRETWASRKLRKTFRLKDAKEKYEEEDQTDGKANKADDDEDHPAKFRNKWRMVLNIKKLEHGGKKPEDELAVPPTSPFVKQATASPHHSLSSIILHPFRSQRQDSEDDMMYLYPWRKRLFRRSEESSVAVKSVMKTSVADDYEGLEGSSKLWIGKDYVNFIHKDPVDVHNPFEDFIERDKTPRMPWHDIGAVVYGKAARDVARHFILRWNFCKTEKFKTNKQFPILLPKSYAKCEVSPAIKEITYGVNTQILRSVCGWSAGINTTEKSIHEAYIDCIKRSKHYIYIENQFFISQVGDHSLVRNEIAEALVERIERAYREKETFRVYVVLPLLPAFEGEIGANGGYAIQAVLHWNYKSMSKGENSLWANLQKKVDDPKKYIIFCGLRSHAELRGKLVTELVYVHSKLMIVDDNTVIIGSANINDRSMNGTRDSELAVMVEDTQTFPVKMAGKDHMAGRFASSLRRTLFREHLGIGEMDFSVDLSDPVCDEFYKTVWLHRASINTTIYHKVFKCIPDDGIKTFAELREMATKTPLAETDPVAANLELKKVQGRIVFMPLYFLEHEDTIMAQGANKEAMMPMKLWL